MERQQFELFFRANYNKAFYLALRFLHDEEAGRDVVSESFERVWVRSEESDDINNLTSYLMMTVKNMCLEQLRRQQLHDNYAKLELHQMEKAADDDASLTIEREQRQEKLAAAIDQLTPRTRQIVKACYVERKKYREVANELNISESGVKKHIMQALSFLRQKFKDSDL